MQSCALAGTQSHNIGEGDKFHGITGIYKSAGSRFWESLEGGKRLFGRDKCTGNVDVEMLLKCEQVDVERIIRCTEGEIGCLFLR
jgi:hypothetical protein